MKLYTPLIKLSKHYSRKNMSKYINEYIDELNISSDAKVLNIGAGGEISKILNKRFWNVLEMDIDINRKPDIVMDIQEMSFNEKFDVVFCLEVLEHVKNPFKAAKQLKKVTNKVIFSTPFMNPIHDAPDDYYRYTKYGLRQVFKGWRLKLKERNSYIESVWVMLLRLLNIGTKKQRIVAALSLPLIFLISPALLLLNLWITNSESTTGYFGVATI